MAQLDVQQAKDSFGWIGLAVSIVLLLFGGGSILTILIKAFVERHWGKKDKDAEIHESNQANKLEADGLFRDSLIKRIETLETKLEDMQKQQLSQAITNERLTVENSHLKEDKDRQEVEIKDLKQRNRALSDKVSELTGFVHRLEIRISELTGRPDRLVDTEELKP